MNVTIEQTPYKIYPNTFLQNVVVVMGFEGNAAGKPDQDIPVDRLKTFLLDNFGFVLPEGETRNFASLSNDDMGLNFQFYNNKTSLRVNCKNYQSFEATIMPLVYKLRAYVREVLGRDSVDYVKIRKVNMFPFQLPEQYDESIYGQMMHHLLNNDLLDCPSEESEQIENGKTPLERHLIEDDKYVFTIKTGVIKASDREDVCVVILDTSSRTTNTVPVALSEIETNIRQQNQRMFDLFHWTVNDEVIEVMEMPSNKDSEDESSI